jgi:hypothetical protein
MTTVNPTIWRVRQNYGSYIDVSEEVWVRKECGIWYGGYSTEDFKHASKAFPNLRWDTAARKGAIDFINQTSGQRHMATFGHWAEIDDAFLLIANRFFNEIKGGDWVLFYLRSPNALGMAQLGDDVYSEADHPYSEPIRFHGESFKYRKLYNQKTFALNKLTDAYKILSQAGRGNVYRINGMYEHVKLLALYNTPEEINVSTAGLSFDKQLEMIGPKAWEYLTGAYLSIERGFVATLGIGSTLRDLDHVGVNITNGKPIIAQAKKPPYPVAIEETFVSHISPGTEAYYFAYGGVTEPKPGIEAIDGPAILRWITETERGKRYWQHLLGQP